MSNRISNTLTAFFRVVRAFTGASLIALAFPVVILAVGTSIALILRGLHEAVSWLARLAGSPSAIGGALVSVASVAGSVIVSAVLIRLLVEFLHWRRRLRAREMTAHTTRALLSHSRIAEAA